MSRFLKILTSFMLLLLIACNDNEVIPQKDMVKILTKIYLTDGTINSSERHSLSDKDTIAYYEPILNSYGYSIAQFDSSIKFYSRNTEVFDEILDRVIIELSKMEDKPKDPTQVDDSTEFKEIDSTVNFWPHKTYWDMSVDHSLNPSLGFEIPVKGFGEYKISFDAQMFPDDKSEDPRMYIFFYYDDKTTTGNRSNPILKNYIKDSVIRNYTYTLELKDSMVTHLNGWLFDHGGESKTLQRHIIFSNISVTFKKAEVKLPKKELIGKKELQLHKGLSDKKKISKLKPVER